MNIVKTETVLLAVSVASLALPKACLGMDDVEKAKTVVRGIADRDLAEAHKYIDAQRFINHDVESPGGGLESFNAFSRHLPRGKSPIQVINRWPTMTCSG